MVILDCSGIAIMLEKLRQCEDSTRLLETLNQGAGSFAWEWADLFLFSADLDSFYFPRDTKGPRGEEVRTQLISAADEAEEPGDGSFFEQQLQKSLNEKVVFVPLKELNQPRGFLVLSYLDRTPEPGEGELLGAFISLMLEKFSINRKLEKSELEAGLLQQEAARSANLRVLGEMVGGITHDFNNILTGVTGFSQLIQMLDEDPDTQESVADILTASDQGKRIISFISKTKKVTTDEASREVTPKSLMEQAAFGLGARLSLERPGVRPEQFFRISDNSGVSISVPETLGWSLLMHLYGGFISAGASAIESSAISGDDGVIIKVKPLFEGAAPGTPSVERWSPGGRSLAGGKGYGGQGWF